MKYSISEAARIIGVTRKTLYKHIDKKPISTEKDDSGNPVIDASELMRVYGDQCKFNRSEVTDTQDKGKQVYPDVTSDLNVDIAVTKKELELLQKQISNERQNFEEQIDYLRGKLDEATSESRKLTALLTDQSKTDNSGVLNTLKSLEERIANQEKTALAKAEQEAKDREEAEKKIAEQGALLKEQEEALALEKSKSFLHKLFGK